MSYDLVQSSHYFGLDWIKKEAKKLPSLINWIEKNPNHLLAMNLDSGYPSYLMIFEPISKEELAQKLTKSGWGKASLEQYDGQDLYWYTSDRELEIMMPDGCYFGFTENIKTKEITVPFSKFKVFSFDKSVAYHLINKEIEKIKTMAIKELESEILEIENAVKSAKPGRAIEAQITIDKFVNEDGDGYTQPIPMNINKIEGAKEIINEKKAALEYWQQLEPTVAAIA